MSKEKTGNPCPNAVLKGCRTFVIREGEKIIKATTAAVIKGI
jgi:hypothetical protein